MKESLRIYVQQLERDLEVQYNIQTGSIVTLNERTRVKEIVRRLKLILHVYGN